MSDKVENFPTRDAAQSHPESVIRGGGQMGALIRSMDWSKTSVGEISSWPQSLKTTVNMLLNSKFPMFLWWGPDLVQFYNDAYRSSFGTEGEKHPQAMGQKGKDCWQEIWHIIYPQIEQVLNEGTPTWNENQLVPIYRNGILEEVYWTYSYSPAFNDDGKVEGVLVVVTETTKEVVNQRRTKFLAKLSATLTGIKNEDRALGLIQSVLEKSADIQGSLLYLKDSSASGLRIKYKSGFAFENCIVGNTDEQVELSISDVAELVSESPSARTFPLVHEGISKENGHAAPQRIYCSPVTLNGIDSTTGVTIFGLNPMLLFDEHYHEFLDSVSAEITDTLEKCRFAERKKKNKLELERVRNEAENLKKRLFDLFMNTPAIMAVFSGPELICEVANPPLKRLLGTQREIDGISLFEMLPDLDEEIRSIIESVAQKGERFISKELPVTVDWDNRGNATTKYFELLYEPLYSEGKPNGMMAFAYDVTEHVLAKERLEEQNEILKSVAEGRSLEEALNALVSGIENQSISHVRASILLMDKDGKHLRHGAAPRLPDEYNRAVDGIETGPNNGSCGTAAFLKKPVIVSDISNDPLWREYKDLALSHGLRACWSTPIFSEGERVLGTFALYYSSPQIPTNKDKQLVDFATRTASLLIQRKESEEALKESANQLQQQKRMYDSITASTPDLVYVLDSNYRFLYANQAILDMWGNTLENSIGKPLSELGYEPWQVKRHQKEVDEVFGTKETLRRQVSFNHATQGNRIYDYIFAPIFDDYDNVVAVAGTARDITDLKALEEQKDQFIAVASHELKTPITSLKVYTQILQERFENESDNLAAGFMAKMDAQINKLTSLVNDLLDITKMRGGKLQFNFQHFEINELISEITEEIQRTTDDHQLQIHTSENAIVLADRDRIGQVLTNYLTNAIKYSPKANKVEIRSRVSNGFIVVSVEDFGLGIPDENKESIFQQFYRVEGEVRESLPGLGIGLYISKAIILRHGGKVWFDSIDGQGSVFHFELPLSEGTIST